MKKINTKKCNLIGKFIRCKIRVNVGGQLKGLKREINCSSGSYFFRYVIMRAVWHVASSCRNHISTRSIKCILGEKFEIMD